MSRQIATVIFYQVTPRVVTLLKFIFSYCLFQTNESVFRLLPLSGSESSTSFTSYVVYVVSVHLALILQPLQFRLLPSVQ
jgi:hypothetical protein